MKKQSLLFAGLVLFATVVACTTTKKRTFNLLTKKTDPIMEEVRTNINNFIAGNKKENKPNVYAVASFKEHVGEHFPDLDLDELNRLYPDTSVGIRIYYAKKGNEILNYLVFTQKNKHGKMIADDIIGPIYQIDGKAQIYPLKPEHHIDILSNHHSCEPDCPEISIMNIMK